MLLPSKRNRRMYRLTNSVPRADSIFWECLLMPHNCDSAPQKTEEEKINENRTRTTFFISLTKQNSQCTVTIHTIRSIKKPSDQLINRKPFSTANTNDDEDTFDRILAPSCFPGKPICYPTTADQQLCVPSRLSTCFSRC